MVAVGRVFNLEYIFKSLQNILMDMMGNVRWGEGLVKSSMMDFCLNDWIIGGTVSFDSS